MRIESPLRSALRLGKRWPQGALLSASLLLARVANAEPHAGLDLSWSAPAECPQQRAVRARIRALAGPSARKDAAPRVEGEVTRVGTRFRLKLVVRDGKLSGERTIESESCTDLVGAAAVAITLLMRSGEPAASAEPPRDTASRDASSHDSSSRDASSHDSSSSDGSSRDAGSRDAGSRDTNPNGSNSRDAEPSSPSEAVDEARPVEGPAKGSDSERAQKSSRDTKVEEPASPASTERRWRVLLVAPLASADFGLLPTPSFGLGAAAGMSYERWRVRVGGQVFLPQQVRADGLVDYAVDVHRVAATVTACRGFGDSRFEIAPCFGISVERLTARGVGAHIVSDPQQATWLALGPGATGRWNVLASLAFMLELGLRIETSRPSLAIGGLGDQQLGPVAFNLALGPEWIF